MSETKISFKVYTPLIDATNMMLANAFIKRDAFLNQIIRIETDELATEMKGLKLSNKARQHIAGKLKLMGTTLVNVKVESVTAEQLNMVVKESNMVRDAFFNRLLMFLTASPKLLDLLGFPATTSSRSLDTADGVATSPIPAINEIVGNPLWYYRQNLTDADSGLYRLELSKNLRGLTCYIEDYEVPGTRAFNDFQKELEEFRKDNEIFGDLVLETTSPSKERSDV